MSADAVPYIGPDAYIKRSRDFWVFRDEPPGEPGSAEYNQYRDNADKHVLYMTHAEIGEVAGLFQKVYQGYPLDRDKLLLELGDVLWCCARKAEGPNGTGVRWALDADWAQYEPEPDPKQPWRINWALEEMLAWTPQTMSYEALVHALASVAKAAGTTLATLAALNLSKLEPRYATGEDGRKIESWLSTLEVSELMDPPASRSNLWRRARDGTLPATRIGGAWFFKRDDLGLIAMKLGRRLRVEGVGDDEDQA